MNFTDPRKAALFVLNELARRNSNLDRILDEQANRLFSQMPRRDRALANALVYGVLRWRANLDWHIASFASRPVNRIKPEILNILRIGVFQMMFMSRIPQSAAVNTSVEMAKEFAPGPVVRFVNGLLRNAARSRQAVSGPDPEKDPVKALAVDQSFPQWLVKRWKNRFGIGETRLLCEYLNEIPPVTIRTNTLKTTRDSLVEKLSASADSAEKTAYSRHGIAMHGITSPVDQLTGFEEGLFQVQDEAAQLAGLVLAPQPAESVLDACAGLGGKTGHLAQCMENQGRLVAVDSEKAKLCILDSEMKRLGITIVETRCLDMETPGSDTDPEGFERIMVDAPCSGLGVIRRNPDIKWSAHKRDMDRHSLRQTRILAVAAGHLKPGGTLVYAVCSMEPEETDSVADGFCEKSKEFEIDPIGSRPEDPRIGADEKGYLRLFPHLHGTDGFFVARFKRK
ncbi:MAG: 16S rRNA (cytosine(967)-C(5))-methyltransferase RsmB [Thermodesulfobacteriota bacterium]